MQWNCWTKKDVLNVDMLQSLVYLALTTKPNFSLLWIKNIKMNLLSNFGEILNVKSIS